MQLQTNLYTCVVYCFDTKKKQEKNNPWCELTNQILKDMFGLSHLSNTFDEALSNIVQKHPAKVRIPQLCVCTYGAWLRRNFPLNPKKTNLYTFLFFDYIILLTVFICLQCKYTFPVFPSICILFNSRCFLSFEYKIHFRIHKYLLLVV